MATTVGRARLGFEIRIVDGGDGESADRDVPAGGTGEILVRGPTVMAGYLNRHELAFDQRSAVDAWARMNLGHEQSI